MPAPIRLRGYGLPPANVGTTNKVLHVSGILAESAVNAGMEHLFQINPLLPVRTCTSSGTLIMAGARS